MVNQTQIRPRETEKAAMAAQAKLREGKEPGTLPLVNFPVNRLGPQQIGAISKLRTLIWRRRTVHVVTPAIVLCAVLAVFSSARLLWNTGKGWQQCRMAIPLREVLVAANVSSLARLAPFP